MFALGWCQEIKVLAETPLCLLSTVSDCTPTSICSGRLEYTHTLTRSQIIYFYVNLMHFIIRVGEPHCLCLSVCRPACLPAYPSVCVYVSLSACAFLHPICLHVCLSGGCTVLNCLFLAITTE